MDPFTVQLIGTAIGLYGSSKANDAYKQMAAEIEAAAQAAAGNIRGMAEPYLESGRYALPAMKQLTMRYGSKIGKNDPFLAALHMRNLQRLGREEQRQLAGSQGYWGATGNVGRGRGEALRIRRGATEAMNVESLGYGQGQQEYQAATEARYMQGLGALGGYGTVGLGAGTEAEKLRYQGVADAARLRGEGTASMWGDVAGAAGDWTSAVGAAADRKQRQKLLDELLKPR